MTKTQTPAAETPDEQQAPSSPAKPLTPEAQRALAEAEARRKLAASAQPPEVGGRDGPDPVRYGDWEKGGLTSDF
jgi:hypothetical protein